MHTKPNVIFCGAASVVLAGALAVSGSQFVAAKRAGGTTLTKWPASGLTLKQSPAGAGSGSALSQLEMRALAPLDLGDMRLWNWQGTWHASHWDHAFSDVPWRFGNVQRSPNGDVRFHLDRTGAPELQGMNQPPQTKGLWQTDVTLPDLASGLVVAPLWVYNQKTKDEIDFEFAGKEGLQVTIHSFDDGQHKQAHVTVPGSADWSGRRVRFAIRVDLDAGWINMLVNGQVVHTFTRDENPEAFPSSGLKPFISMWPAKSGLAWAESWVGAWDGMPASMIVHGFRFSP